MADFELTDAQDRRILLRDNGSWTYVDPKEGANDKSLSATPVAQAERSCSCAVTHPLAASSG